MIENLREVKELLKLFNRVENREIKINFVPIEGSGNFIGITIRTIRDAHIEYAPKELVSLILACLNKKSDKLIVELLEEFKKQVDMLIKVNEEGIKEVQDLIKKI